MRSITILLSTIIFLLTLSSCDKDDTGLPTDNQVQGDQECPEEDELAGLALELIQVTDSCILTIDQNDQLTDGVVIRSDSEYEQLLNTVFSGIEDCVITPVDFGQYSMLAVLTGGSGCSRTYRREVLEQQEEDLIECRITIRECGGCEPWAQVVHWILVDTLPENQEVLFTTRRESYDE